MRKKKTALPQAKPAQRVRRKPPAIRRSASSSPAPSPVPEPCITLADYFMGRDRLYADELTQELATNAQRMVERANALLHRAGLRRAVNSGWRPAAVNAAISNAAKKSKHLLCLAIDIDDDDGALDAWCMAHPDVLEELGLWLEHPSATPRWCHVQIVQYGSWAPGKPRYFYP
jgi:hypothetical protein